MIKSTMWSMSKFILLLSILLLVLAACSGAEPAVEEVQEAAEAVVEEAEEVVEEAEEVVEEVVEEAEEAMEEAEEAMEEAEEAMSGDHGDEPLCGLGNGEAATGESIKIGAIVGETGPDDFSSPADTAKAYFDCVNANGGINGRPIEYLVEDDQWNPEVASQAAGKLVNDEGVVALIGNASFVEMGVNSQFYSDEDVLVIAAACATSECFESKNIASTNAGPLGSNLQMTQWAVENIDGVSNVACIGLNIPTNGGWSCGGVVDWLEANGYAGTSVLFDPASADLTSVVLEAIASGADTMLMNLPAGVATGILKAAEEQDLRDSYTWISPTPLYDLDIPAALGPYWDGAVYVHIELTPLTADFPDTNRWREVMDTYASPDDPRDTFSQSGFVAADMVTHTLLQMDPDSINRETVTEAIRNITNFESDLLCAPWYFGPGERHFPNHHGQIARISGDGFEIMSECFSVEGEYFDDVFAIEEELGIGSGEAMMEESGDSMAMADDALCGLGNGEAATGEPIKIGAIVGETGPDDFSSPADTAKAYFDCVNANGGINGRPIEYLVEDDQWNPEVASQAAGKLVNDEGVVALIGNASFVEMGVNSQFYSDEDVLVIAAACATSECFESKNIASTNAGPLGSNLQMTQWAVENLDGVSNVACIGLNIPTNGGWSCGAVVDWLEANGYAGTSVLFDPASADLTSVVLEAIASGADTMLMNLPAGVATGILKAAEEQDLRDSYTWISPTPLYDLDIPAALGEYWDGAVYVHIELTPLTADFPDTNRWREVMDTYASPDDPRDTFSQSGFVAADMVTHTLLQMDPDNINRETVTEAIRNITNFESDLLCAPWYFGPGERHFPNHHGQIARISGDGFEIMSECFSVEGEYFDDVFAIEEELGIGQ